MKQETINAEWARIKALREQDKNRPPNPKWEAFLNNWEAYIVDVAQYNGLSIPLDSSGLLSNAVEAAAKTDPDVVIDPPGSDPWWKEDDTV